MSLWWRSRKACLLTLGGTALAVLLALLVLAPPGAAHGGDDIEKTPLPIEQLPVGYPQDCPLVYAVSVGIVCDWPEGMQTFAPDGTPSPYIHPSHGAGAGMLGTRSPYCISPGEQFWTEVIYARAFDDTNNYASMAPTVRTMVEMANWRIDADTTGGDADIRVRCSAGQVIVQNAVLPTPKASTTFNTIRSDLISLGIISDPKVHYTVYFDHWQSGWAGGLGSWWSHDTAAWNNWNNGYSGSYMMAVTFGYTSHPSTLASTLLHEWTHNSGGVQNSAPYGTGGAHCWDGTDIMCYDDSASGSPYGYLYTTSYCSGYPYDCNKNSYYNTAPAPGSYLDSHWNLGHPWHRYLFFSAYPCANPSPTLPTTPTGVWVTGSGTTATVHWNKYPTGACAPDHYEILRDTTSPPTTVIATNVIPTASSIQTYVDAPLATCTQYYYAIRAVNYMGSSADSAPASYLTATSPPSAPQNFEVNPAAFPDLTTAIASWDPPASPGCGVDGYELYRDGGLIATNPPWDLQHEDSPLLYCEEHDYDVRAWSTMGGFGPFAPTVNYIHDPLGLGVCDTPCDPVAGTYGVGVTVTIDPYCTVTPDCSGIAGNYVVVDIDSACHITPDLPNDCTLLAGTYGPSAFQVTVAPDCTVTHTPPCAAVAGSYLGLVTIAPNCRVIRGDCSFFAVDFGVGEITPDCRIILDPIGYPCDDEVSRLLAPVATSSSFSNDLITCIRDLICSATNLGIPPCDSIDPCDLVRDFEWIDRGGRSGSGGDMPMMASAPSSGSSFYALTAYVPLPDCIGEPDCDDLLPSLLCDPPNPCDTIGGLTGGGTFERYDRDTMSMTGALHTEGTPTSMLLLPGSELAYIATCIPPVGPICEYVAASTICDPDPIDPCDGERRRMGTTELLMVDTLTMQVLDSQSFSGTAVAMAMVGSPQTGEGSMALLVDPNLTDCLPPVCEEECHVPPICGGRAGRGEGQSELLMLDGNMNVLSQATFNFAPVDMVALPFTSEVAMVGITDCLPIVDPGCGSYPLAPGGIIHPVSSLTTVSLWGDPRQQSFVGEPLALEGGSNGMAFVAVQELDPCDPNGPSKVQLVSFDTWKQKQTTLPVNLGEITQLEYDAKGRQLVALDVDNDQVLFFPTDGNGAITTTPTATVSLPGETTVLAADQQMSGNFFAGYML